MKINIEYDPNDPEDVILAERIIKCNGICIMEANDNKTATISNKRCD